MTILEQPKYSRDTSWEAIEAESPLDGVTLRSFTVGSKDGDPDRPRVVRATFPPGHRVDPHSHVCDYAEIILQGTQQVTRRWYGPGDIRIVQAGTVYGPLIAGPDGCTVLLVFSSGVRTGVRPQDLAAHGLSHSLSGAPNASP